VKITVVGCSPAWPNPGGAQSGYLVEDPGRILLDCGPGVLGRLREKEPWPHVDAIAITHFHLDHWGDLVPWVWGAMYGPGHETAQPELYLPPNGRELLGALGEHLGVREMFEHTFQITEFSEGVPFAAAGFSLVALRLDHYSEETYGLRVSNHASTLAYSGDTGPSENLAELARDADVFLCEATLKDPEPAERGHLSEDEAVAAFEESGAKRLIVIHRPDELGLAPSIERAVDGDVLTF